LFVYPNPVREIARVILPANGTGNITIMNSLRQTAYEEEIKYSVSYKDVNTEVWPNGLYLIKWQGEDGIVLTAKMIKN